MDTVGRRRPDESGIRPHPEDLGDFVAVDETGDFSYYTSEQDLRAGFEYVGEAACILDRAGMQYRLVLDPNRQLRLGPALGPVDLQWLSQAWANAQKRHANAHRLRRLHTSATAGLLPALFETLALESGTEQTMGPWIIAADGDDEFLPSLTAVDRRLAARREIHDVQVQDPFGHTYRPMRQRKRWSMPFAAGSIYYVEVPDRA